MFLLDFGRHVGAHMDGHQHGVSKQISVNLGKKFLHISHKKNCCDQNFGESLCIFTFFHFPDSGLYLLTGFDFYFDLFWIAWHWKPAIPKFITWEFSFELILQRYFFLFPIYPRSKVTDFSGEGKAAKRFISCTPSHARTPWKRDTCNKGFFKNSVNTFIWNTTVSKGVNLSSSWSYLNRRLKNISAITVLDDFQKKIMRKAIFETNGIYKQRDWNNVMA